MSPTRLNFFLLFLNVVFIAAAAVGVGHASRATRSDWSNTPTPYVVTYLGRPLHCLVVEDGSTVGNIGGLTCDYVRYWSVRRGH